MMILRIRSPLQLIINGGETRYLLSQLSKVILSTWLNLNRQLLSTLNLSLKPKSNWLKSPLQRSPCTLLTSNIVVKSQWSTWRERQKPQTRSRETIVASRPQMLARSMRVATAQFRMWMAFRMAMAPTNRRVKVRLQRLHGRVAQRKSKGKSLVTNQLPLMRRNSKTVSTHNKEQISIFILFEIQSQKSDLYIQVMSWLPIYEALFTPISLLKIKYWIFIDIIDFTNPIKRKEFDRQRKK